jgi:hypothetical protein
MNRWSERGMKRRSDELNSLSMADLGFIPIEMISIKKTVEQDQLAAQKDEIFDEATSLLPSYHSTSYHSRQEDFSEVIRICHNFKADSRSLCDTLKSHLTPPPVPNLRPHT